MQNKNEKHLTIQKLNEITKRYEASNRQDENILWKELYPTLILQSKYQLCQYLRDKSLKLGQEDIDDYATEIALYFVERYKKEKPLVEMYGYYINIRILKTLSEIHPSVNSVEYDDYMTDEDMDDYLVPSSKQKQRTTKKDIALELSRREEAIQKVIASGQI
jgi:hypothetical protein